jgi:hypothetical protein
MAEQSYASHRKWHPLFHFILVPIFVANVISTIVTLWRWPSKAAVWHVVIAMALLALVILVRLYALRVQDRLIRLEERLRLQQLLPPELQARIGDIRTSQLIAMRFCHDDEVCDVARAILDGEVKTADEIKRRIRTWRADWLRV